MAASSVPKLSFRVAPAKTGRSSCKDTKCLNGDKSIPKGSLRIGKVTPSYFDPDDLEGFNDLDAQQQADVSALVAKAAAAHKAKVAKKGGKQGTLGGFVQHKHRRKHQRTANNGSGGGGGGGSATASSAAASAGSTSGGGGKSHSGKFSEYCDLCEHVMAVSSQTAKTAIIRKFVDGFTGNLVILFRLLLPTLDKRVYNMKQKNMVKVFAPLLGATPDELTRDVEKGDVSQTLAEFLAISPTMVPPSRSTLTLQDVDNWLGRITTATKESDQTAAVKRLLSKATPQDLKWVIRLMLHDLKIGAQAKNVLPALHSHAYEAYTRQSNLANIINHYAKARKAGKTGGAASASASSSSATLARSSSIGMMVMTPVKPMLAKACKSFEECIRRCPEGFFAEIKYDGERVQIHKNGDNYQYFSRSLKPVQPYKIKELEQYIPKAFPECDTAILDAELLVVDPNGVPLPFGSLGKHKRLAFGKSTTCVFVFDILHYNGNDLMHKPIKHRRELLEKYVTEIPRRVRLSELSVLKKQAPLKALMQRAMDEGLEGLVMKACDGVYEPGKRHWLKMKKDYLGDGSMADSADLVVVGAYYGTGSKGGMMSVFLMGCYDSDIGKWKTVCKVGNGHDDATLDRLNKTLKVTKIFKDKTRVPGWLLVNSALTPDFVVDDPWKAPVWEITGAEFSESKAHTADGYSIRFPRVTRERTDKDAKGATTLKYLKTLIEESTRGVTGSAKGLGSSSSTGDSTAADADLISPWSFCRTGDTSAGAGAGAGAAAASASASASVRVQVTTTTVVTGTVSTGPVEDDNSDTDVDDGDGGDDGDGDDDDDNSSAITDVTTPAPSASGGGAGGGAGAAAAAASATAAAADGGDGDGWEVSDDGAEDDDGDDADGADTRPDCKFGTKCYRKNPGHLAMYYHPQHDGPRKVAKPKPTPPSPPPAAATAAASSSPGGPKRIVCPYGAKCYRKNLYHWQTHIHPGDPDFVKDDEDDEDLDGIDRRNILPTRQRKRKRVSYRDPGSDEEEFEDDEDSDNGDGDWD